MTKNNVLRVLHQYNAGDLIASMPGFQHYYQETGIKTCIYQRLGLPAFYYQGAEHPVKNDDGQQITMNRSIYDMLKPLMDEQEYIASFEIWKGETVDFDFRLTRDSREMPLPYGDINSWPFLMFPQLTCDLSKPWIHLPEWHHKDYREKIIINRTFRYTNPHVSYYFLKAHEKDVFFAGVDSEYQHFKNEFDLNIGRVVFEDFYDAAHCLAQCKFFIGNQSFLYHLAESLKIPRILEVSSTYPNTWPHGASGYPFTHQSGLEYYFNKLKPLDEAERTP